MPIELHVDAAGPLDHRVAADGIVERLDLHIGAGGPGLVDGGVHIPDQKTIALGAERVRDRRFEIEHREAAGRRQYQLGVGFARRGRDVDQHAFGAGTAEGFQDAVDKGIHLAAFDVDMGGVILRPYGETPYRPPRTLPGAAAQGPISSADEKKYR